MCHIHEETSFHLLFRRHINKRVWEYFYAAFKVNGRPTLIKNSMEYCFSRGIPRGSSQSWSLVMGAITWGIWNACNNLIFKQLNPSFHAIIDDTHSLLHSWIFTSNKGADKRTMMAIVYLTRQGQRRT